MDRQRPMAFIRKRGNGYYLVHCLRKKGRVQQIHLASLGRRPAITDDVIRGVTNKHPWLQIDWRDLKEKASQEAIRPVGDYTEYLRELLSDVRNVHLGIADLHLPALEMTDDRELKGRLITELRLLRGTLDVKLNLARKGRLLPFRA
ncbi:MAG: hypothetical protein ACRD3T_03455 [Terriglobia bacterium]